MPYFSSLNSYFHLMNCFRSAVLFSLKAFPLALDDIQLAFEMGYPDGKYWCSAIRISTICYISFPSDLAYKLYDRKAKCLLPFKRMKEVKESWKKGWVGRRKGYFKTSNKRRERERIVNPMNVWIIHFIAQIIALPSFTTLCCCFVRISYYQLTPFWLVVGWF